MSLNKTVNDTIEIENDIIEKEINIIKKEISRISELAPEYLFSLVCYKYYYNKGELSYQDYVDTFVDGKDDGGIDLVQVIEDSNDHPSLYLIQSKNIRNLANSNDVIDMFTKMANTINNFQNDITAKYNKRLKQKLRDKLSEIDDVSSSVVLVVFLNTDLSAVRRKKIDKEIRNIELFSQYTIEFYDKNQIINQINSIHEPKRFVDEAKIKICKENGKIEYGKNGLLVNVYASSIKYLILSHFKWVAGRGSIR